jgi:ACS family hexuronate transporter-like MFS transporter
MSSKEFPENLLVQGGNQTIKHLRWYICGLIFLATTINYIDRQVLGILKNTLQMEIGWNEVQYGAIVMSFQLAYALSLVGVGRTMDLWGTRKGYAFSISFWSLAAMSHALVKSTLGMGVARFFLGLGEGGNFPAAIKTVAEWFPQKERALATGIFNAGSNVGAVVAPLVVPWIAITYGWRWAFVLTGAIGFFWLFLWFKYYHRPEEHPHLSEQELAFIKSDPPDPEAKIPWSKLIRHRQTWAFAIGKFMTDPIWWFYLFWIPDYLNKQFGLNLTQLGLPLITIYILADIGSIGGGWLSSSFIKHGLSINKARKLAMFICALAVLPIMLASKISNMWLAVGLVGLAAAAHQGWSANIFTIVSDMFPRKAVGSVVGFGGMGGAIGGMFISGLVGVILQLTGSYFVPFVIAGTTYLLALGIIHILLPRLEPAKLDAEKA